MNCRFVASLGLATAAFIFGVPNARAQIANQPPVPSWLTGSARYETSFERPTKLLKAILLVAGDGPVAVTVNGSVVGTATGPAVAKSIDITRQLREGTNRIELGAHPGVEAKPARVAALLELNGDLAATRWLVTDDSWKAGGKNATVAGKVDADPNVNPFDLKKTFDAYNSWQLAKRDQQSQATDPADFTMPAGFKVELIRSAQPDEDSWVAMAFDPQGRLTLAREKKGLWRTVAKAEELKGRAGEPAVRLEVIDDSLLECRGLVYAHGALYAHANNSKGLYRLRDVDGDGLFDEKQELMHTEGGVGHGRNHIKLGPDGNIWVANGNNVLLPSPLAETSPLRNYAADQVLPNPWDGTMFDGTVELPAGHVLRMAPDGSEVQLIAGGLRNALDVAFNREGELFTFDADMERDVGASWYMPTRVLHVVSGADFGWRRGTGRFPAWYADTLPSVVDIGLSSPTAIFFGYGAKFPSRYQEALFIFDWSYGRIIAVHLRPNGASYRGEQETFISGRPLNVTDGCIGPDGAMWFITGGRGTQSGLYRVTHDGQLGAQEPVAKDGGKALREARHQLEALHSGIAGDQRESALRLILPNIDHDDRFIRHAARVALEQLPADLWRGQVVSGRGWGSLTGCLALARVGNNADRVAVIEHLRSQPWFELHEAQQLAALRTVDVALARLGVASLDAARRTRLLGWLEPLYPARSQSFAMNQELCRLLVTLKSEVVLKRSLALLRDARSSEELIFYPVHLRYIQDGWSADDRRVVFDALNRAEKLNGASTYFKAIQDTRSELAAALKPEEAQQLAAIIHAPKPVALSSHALPGHTFKAWKLEDLLPRLDQVGKGRSFEKGRAAAVSSQCVFCHRVSNDPSVPAGVFGPELVQVSARFNRRDLLDHILNPSKVIDEKFRFVTVTRADGTQVTGSLESEDDERVKLRPNPLSPDTVEIGKTMIRNRKISEVSPMPPGLLNALRAEQILDLLAFLEAGGNPAHRDFQP